MSEIELIPLRYRQLSRLRRAFRHVGVFIAVAATGLCVAKLGVVRAIGHEQTEIDRLRGVRSDSIDQRAKLDDLRKQQRMISGRLKVLDELRGAVPAKNMFLVLDRVLQDDVWFKSWQFRRAGEFVQRSDSAVQTGYFLVIPASSGDPEQDKTWRLDTHMEIRGRAADYAALASFVRRLVGQPEIQDVRVLSTRTAPPTMAVDFDVAIVVASHA